MSDISLRTVLPRKLVAEGVEAGWAEPHPLAGYGPIPDTIVTLYAPRDDTELEARDRSGHRRPPPAP